MGDTAMESRKGALEATEKEIPALFIHIIFMLGNIVINRGTKGRNVLTCAILGGAAGALHQLLSSQEKVPITD